MHDLTFDAFGFQGTPYAYFPSQSCNISEHFGAHNLIINLTFCAPFFPAGVAPLYFLCASLTTSCAASFYSIRWRLGGRSVRRRWLSRRLC